MENNQNGFQYTYSAKEQAEIKRIRSKYTPKEENKMEQLQRLDASATQKATKWAIIVGVIGVIGLAVVGVAYPLYNRTLKKERERIAPEILRLTDELMK